ncbi:MAG: ferrous iron transport protein A [Pyrinomonadaceae bacterium]
MKRKTSMTLADLARGESRNVVSVHGDDAITRRLMEMGVVPGVAVRMVKAAPFGDPLEIKVRGYSLALRRSEAESVVLEKVTINE